MLGNTFGRMFRVTTVGESYGIGKGSGLAVIIDGVPPGLELTDAMIQEQMDKRRPGVGKLNSPRLETDQCHIFAGLGQDGVTTGAPVGIIIYNVDTQKVHIEEYRDYKDLCRPGHATYAFFRKYGPSQDWCGAGRSSGRETVGRVAQTAVYVRFTNYRPVQGHTCKCHPEGLGVHGASPWRRRGLAGFTMVGAADPPRRAVTIWRSRRARGKVECDLRERGAAC